MPRTCTICTHPEKDAINEALLKEGPLRDIARQWSVSKDALSRHRSEHLPAHLAQAKEAEEVAQADNLVAELRRIMARVNLLFDACDRWLRDPDNPDQYTVDPRAEDIMIIYEEPVGDKEIRRKARLSDLLPKVEEENGITVKLVEARHADPRKLLLDASGRLAGQLELLAKLLGELKENHTVNILVSPEWLHVRSLIVEALALYPEARFAVADALGKVGYVNGRA